MGASLRKAPRGPPKASPKRACRRQRGELMTSCRELPHAGLRAGLLAVASFIAVVAVSAQAHAATVATDQPDYAPGQTVVITGSGWEPGETVVLVLHEDPQVDPDLQLTAVADANGDFTNGDFIVDVFDIGVTFTVTATGTSSGLTAQTTFTDAPNLCRNGALDEGEACDPTAPGDNTCCQNNCTFWDSSHICRAASGDCDLPETCTGTSTTCPADTGAVKAAGTACTDDGNPCTLDQCDGTNVTCQHPAGNAGAVCRAAANECDVAETCTGTSTTCPADAKKPAGTACTPDSNPCTLDQCDGTNVTCQHPAGNPGAVCRAAVNECDVAETCTGTSTTCPTDGFQPSTTPCTDDGDPCTTDVCGGTIATCQH